MVKRLVAALVEGALPGAAVAYGLSAAGATAAPALYLAAALVGMLTGLVAGRPIWAKAAKVEGLLKAIAGAFISVVVLYALRKWLSGVRVDLAAFGSGPIGSVPWLALPVIGVALALVLEIDDAFGGDAPPPERRRVASRSSLDGERLESPPEGEEESGRASRAQRGG